MKAIILAGEGNKGLGPFPEGKALAKVKGVPMIRYVISALRHCDRIEEILVVGNVDTLHPVIGQEVDILISEKESMIDNLLLGIECFKEESHLLIATCDIPLITGEVVEKFIEDGLAKGADICYPIVAKGSCQVRYPDARRTYAPLKEGDFTGGNILLLAPQSVKRIEDIARSMVEHRKNPLKMSYALGLPFIIQFLLRRLTITGLEEYIQKRFGIVARALVSADPEIGNDIDCIEDLRIIEKYI